jgi:hypothetical protein
MIQRPNTHVRDYLGVLTDEMKLTRGRPPAKWQDLTRWDLNFSPLRLSLGHYVPVLFPEPSTERPLGGAQLALMRAKLREFIATTGESFCVAVVPGSLASQNQLAPDDYPEPFAILDGDCMRRIALERDHNRRLEHLGRALAAQTGVRQLSPYLPNEPATGGRFFGRQQTLREILSSTVATSYTIIGPRRIGKTSLLKEIAQRMKEKYSPSILRVADLMAIRYNSTAELVGAIVRALSDRGADKAAYKFEQRPQRARAFVNFIHDLAGKGNRRVVVFLDELDYILEMDRNQDYECMKLLRAAFDHDRCQIFMAGFRETARARDDNRTPLFGFTETIELHPLGTPEANEMVKRPFRHLGIDVPDHVLTAIVERSAGHPQIITYFCLGILAFFDRERRLPDAVEWDEHVFGSPRVVNRISGTFLANTNFFELLFCLLLMRKALKMRGDVRDFHFNYKDIDRLLRESKVELALNQIAAICNSLRLCSIITAVNIRQYQFRFAIPQLVDFFRGMDLDFFIQKASKQVNILKSKPGSISLEGEDEATGKFFEAAASM